MDEESVGVKLVLKLEEYKTKLREALGLTQSTVNQINGQKVKLSGIDEARLQVLKMKQGLADAKAVLNQISAGKIEGKWSEASQEVLMYENGLREANMQLRNLQGNSDSVKAKSSGAFQQAGNEIKKATNKLLRYAGALFGIRAIYSMLQRAASSYLAADTEMSNQIQSTWMALGSLLAPIIQYIANIFATAVSYINAFVQALTGIDYIARGNAKAIASQTKAVKALKNATTGIDELNIISPEDSTGGTTQQPTTFTPTEIDPSKIEKVASIASTTWDSFKVGAGAFIVGFQGIVLVTIGIISGAIEGIVEVVKGIGLGIWAVVKGIGLGIWQIIKGIWDGIIIMIKGFIDGIGMIMQGFKEGDWKKVWLGLKTIVISIVQGLWTALKGVISGILTILKGLVYGIINILIGVVNGVISVINGVIKGLNKIKIPDWVPLFGGSKVNISTISKISYLKLEPVQLATGGIANSSTFAEIGEAGKEGVIPLTNQSAMQELGSIIGKYVQGNGTNEQTILNNVLTLDGNIIYKNQQKISRQKGASIMGGAFA